MNKHITTVSEEAIKQLIVFEGLKLKPYRDSANVPTIGIGTIRYPTGGRVTMFDHPITEFEAKMFMKHDLRTFESGVDALTVDTITQNQFDALVLFAYNVGLGALKGSTLLKKVNKNPNDVTIVEEFTKWIFADGKKVKGLLTRRNVEAKIYAGL